MESKNHFPRIFCFPRKRIQRTFIVVGFQIHNQEIQFCKTTKCCSSHGLYRCCCLRRGIQVSGGKENLWAVFSFFSMIIMPVAVMYSHRQNKVLNMKALSFLSMYCHCMFCYISSPLVNIVSFRFCLSCTLINFIVNGLDCSCLERIYNLSIDLLVRPSKRREVCCLHL